MITDTIKAAMLCDFYGDLLTEHQKKCVELYYNNVFKEYLELSGYLQKKPDNWKDEITKLSDDEMLSRYFYNDFGING